MIYLQDVNIRFQESNTHRCNIHCAMMMANTQVGNYNHTQNYCTLACIGTEKQHHQNGETFKVLLQIRPCLKRRLRLQLRLDQRIYQCWRIGRRGWSSRSCSLSRRFGHGLSVFEYWQNQWWCSCAVTLFFKLKHLTCIYRCVYI